MSIIELKRPYKPTRVRRLTTISCERRAVINQDGDRLVFTIIAKGEDGIATLNLGKIIIQDLPLGAQRFLFSYGGRDIVERVVNGLRGLGVVAVNWGAETYNLNLAPDRGRLIADMWEVLHGQSSGTNPEVA